MILKKKIKHLSNRSEPTYGGVNLGILHNVNGYYVSNEGTKKNPSYHVWVPSVTHANCDSAYDDITLAVCRCDYLAKHKVQMPYQPS